MFLFYRHQLGSVPYLLVVAPFVRLSVRPSLCSLVRASLRTFITQKVYTSYSDGEKETEDSFILGIKRSKVKVILT